MAHACSSLLVYNHERTLRSVQTGTRAAWDFITQIQSLAHTHKTPPITHDTPQPASARLPQEAVTCAAPERAWVTSSEQHKPASLLINHTAQSLTNIPLVLFLLRQPALIKASHGRHCVGSHTPVPLLHSLKHNQWQPPLSGRRSTQHTSQKHPHQSMAPIPRRYAPHNTNTKETDINTPVSPLCRFHDAVTCSGLFRDRTNPQSVLPGLIRCCIRGDGVASLAAAAVMGALLRFSCLLQCSDVA